MRNQTLRSHFRAVTFAVLTAAIAIGCTKKKEEQNKVASGSYMQKTDLTVGRGGVAKFGPQQYHLSRGVEEADSDNNVSATPGMSDDFGIVEARVTEKELQFVSVFDPRGRSKTMKIVASYPITSHFDIVRETNDFGESTHKIVENTDKPWNERAYMRVDWQSPSNTMSNFVAGLVPAGLGQDFVAKEENTVLLEAPTVDKDGHISFLVETSIKTNKTTTFTFPYSFDSAPAYRVTYRTHLMPVKSNGFEAVKYSLEDFQKFGYFFTQQNFENPEKGLQEKDIQLYANVHNVCEKGHPGPCATNQIKWVLSKDFPEFYRAEAKKAVEVWDQTFRDALNRNEPTDKPVVVLDESFEANISDPRYNVIAFYPERTNAGLLGVAQWVSDPRNGELVGVRATVYQDGINGTLGSIDTLIDLLVSKDPLADVIKANPLGAEGTYASPHTGSSTAKRMALRNRVLGTNKKTAARGSSGTPKEVTERALESMSEGVERSNARLAKLVSKVPELLVTGRAGLFEEQLAGQALPFPKVSGGVPIPNLNGMERLIFAHEEMKSKKAKVLQDAKSGIHGTDLVEEAAIRYLLKMLAKGAKVEDLDRNRQMIKDQIAKETYYSTLLHEMGHAFGLRHNFRGSSDKANFHPEYKKLAADLAAGKNGVTQSDLDHYAMSSIMDYGRDFYADTGGLGSYDKAAIKYAYNRKLDREKDPIVKRGFAFCTDHEVEDSILCRRFDKGTNVSEVTLANTDAYNRNYPLMHYRRGRIAEGNWYGWGNGFGLVNGLLSRYMLPTRQVIDELLYMMIGGEKLPLAERKGGYCDFKFVADSIKNEEMAPICSPSQMEAAGVDPLEMGTFINALINRKTGEPYKKASEYVPYGMADLLWANKIAMDFFVDVLGSTEPGRYLALPAQKDPEKNPFTLIKLPLAGSDAEALAEFAQDREIEGVPEFIKQYTPFIVDIPVSKDARVLETITARTAGRSTNEILGSWWDKYAAIIALGTRDFGVEKYDLAEMSTNAYFAPQAQAYATQVFARMINRKGSGNFLKDSTVTLTRQKLKDGTNPVVPVLLEAALNLDIQSIATNYAVGAMTTSSDTSMLNKLRICINGVGGCEAGPNQLRVSEVFVNGKTYRAVQTYENDSISFAMIEEAKKQVARRADAEKAKAQVDNNQAEAIMELSTSAALRTRLDTTLGRHDDLKPIRDAITNGPQSAWSFIEFVTKNLKNVPYFTLAEQTEKIKAMFKVAQGLIDEEISKLNGVPVPATPVNGENAAAAQKTPVAAKPKPLSGEERARLEDLEIIKADMATTVTLLEKIIDASNAARLAPITIKQATQALERAESNMIMLRNFVNEVE